MTTIRCTLFVVLGLGFAVTAHASEPGFYVGGGFGQSDFSGDIDNQIRDAYASDEDARIPSAALTDDSDSAYKLFAGYRFGSGFGLELGWHDLGEARSQYEVRGVIEFDPPPPNAIVPATLEGRYRVRGPSLSAFGEWEFSDSLSGIVRAGFLQASTEYDEASIAGVPRSYSAPDQDDTRPLFGLGLNWHMSPAWDLRLDYDRVNGVGERFAFTNDGNGRFDHIDTLSLNLAYRFGH